MIFYSIFPSSRSPRVNILFLFVSLLILSACTTGYGPALEAWQSAAPQPYIQQTLDWTARAEQAPATQSQSLSSLDSALRVPSSALPSELGLPPDPAAPPEAALSERLAWRDLTAAVTARNPGVRAARERWQATLAQFEQADYLESLVAQYRVFTRELNVEPGNRMNTGMNKEFYPYGGTLALKSAMIRADARMARLEWEMTLRDAQIQAGNAFFDYQYLDRAIVTAGENIKLAADLTDVVERQYRSGVAMQSDLLKAQTALERQRNQLKDCGRNAAPPSRRSTPCWTCRPPRRSVRPRTLICPPRLLPRRN